METVGLQANFAHFGCWDLQYDILSMRYDIFTEAVKFFGAEFAQVSQISPR